MSSHSKNDKREIFGWLMYDWANSVFLTTVVTVLFGDYITRLAQASVGENGVIIDFGNFGALTAKSLFPISISISVFGQVFLLPILGAVADYSAKKKQFMMFFCYLGVAAGGSMFFITGKLYLIGCLLLIVANLAMGASLVFYNAFLNDICTEDQRNKVSSRGFAVGYVAAIIVLIFNLGLIYYAETFGLTKSFATRLSFLLASLWWGGFAWITFKRLKNRATEREIPVGENFLSLGFKELGSTLRELFQRRYTARFLVAYLLYNDGIQTVINASSLFLAQELFVNRGLETNQLFLIGVFLVAQSMGIVGAIVLERLARLIGTKFTILISLFIWAGIVIYAYAFLQETWQAWGMSAAIGFVLGGSQALSRSLFSQMIPPGREAAFFGIYEITDRGTSWIGPVVFGLVAGLTNSYRPAILALIIFFIAGSILLYLTNTDKAIEEANA